MKLTLVEMAADANNEAANMIGKAHSRIERKAYGGHLSGIQSKAFHDGVEAAFRAIEQDLVITLIGLKRFKQNSEEAQTDLKTLTSILTKYSS